MGRKMSPLVSVIIPVHNVKPFLYRSLNSIIQQIYENIQDDLTTQKGYVREMKKHDNLHYFKL